MKIKPITKTMTATALTDPNPAFVSMVTAGANKEPFTVVKADAKACGDKDNVKEPNMKRKASKSTVAAIAPKGFAVMQFDFQKGDGDSQFADETAVKAWLDEGGYDGYQIIETEKTFEVSSDEDNTLKFETGSVKRIDGVADGVAAFVGKTADEQDVDVDDDGDATKSDDDAGDKDDTSKSDDNGDDAAKSDNDTDDATKSDDDADKDDVAKSDDDKPGDDSAAAKSDDTPVIAAGSVVRVADEDHEMKGKLATIEKIGGDTASVVRFDADDTVQRASFPLTQLILPDAEPVEDEHAALKEKIDGVMAQAKKAGVPVTVKKVNAYGVMDILDVVMTLRWIIMDADYSGYSDEVVTKLKSAAMQTLEALTDVTAQLVDEYGEVTKSDDAAKTSKTKSADADASDDNGTDLEATVKAAVEKAVAPLNDKVEAAEAKATKAEEDAGEARKELAERVAADNARGQTQKGADDVSGDESKPAKKTSESSQTANNILRAAGSRHAK